MSGELVHQKANSVAMAASETESDPNEFAKVATYARIHLDGARLFQLLDTIVKDGRYVLRTNRTLDYYRDIRDVCRNNLYEYRNATGEKACELAAILCWAVRLMRYYNTLAGKADLAARQRAAEHRRFDQKRPSTEPTPSSPPTSDMTIPVARPPRPRSETNRETVTLVTAAKKSKARVKTDQGEEIVCTGFPGFPPTKPGNTCRADVTREGGDAVKAVFKGWR